MLSDADRRRAVVRLAVLALAVAAAFAAVTLAGVDVQGWIERSGPLGPLLFVLAGGALGLALFPGNVTATLAGVLFGALAGTGLALAAAVLGAGLCWLAARLLGADATLALLGPRGQRAREWVAANGFGAVLVSRLAPGLPAGPVNYLAGLARIPARAFLAAVALGTLPKAMAYVALGGALSDPLSARGAVAVALYAVAAGLGLLTGRRLVRSRPVAA